MGDGFKGDGAQKHKGHQNGGFKTSLGFILACVGSAVGMGNIWMFPYRVGQYGGAAFLVPYAIFITLFGLVGLSAEFAIGRRARTGTLGSYEYCWASRGKGKLGYALGWIPLLGSLGNAIGYAIIVGWVVRALFGSLTNSILTTDAAVYFSQATGEFGSIPWQDQQGADALLFRAVRHSGHPRGLSARRGGGVQVSVCTKMGISVKSGHLGHGHGTSVFLPVHHRIGYDRLRHLPEKGRGHSAFLHPDGGVRHPGRHAGRACDHAGGICFRNPTQCRTAVNVYHAAEHFPPDAHGAAVLDPVFHFRGICRNHQPGEYVRGGVRVLAEPV